MHHECDCAQPRKRRHKGHGCMPCITSPIMPIYGLCPVPPFPKPCPVPVCMPTGCAPCPFPSFPKLPGPGHPKMLVPTYRVPGPFCCEPVGGPVYQGYGCEDYSGSCASGMSDSTGWHHGTYMPICEMPYHPPKKHHYPIVIHKKPAPPPKPWQADWMRETEIEIGGGIEVEKPNPLGNWMGNLGDWFGKGAGAADGMDGGSKWGNWLGKGGGMMDGMGAGEMGAGGMVPGDMTGGKMGNWLGKGAGATDDRNDDGWNGNDWNENDGSGKKLWPK